MAAGDVVNTTARLQAAAPANGILVGEATYRATRDVIDYREAEAVAAKGKAEPIRVWEAIAPRSKHGVDVVQTGRTALVGREQELTLLLDTAQRVRDRREPQLVTLVGVPGIGKSRLTFDSSAPLLPRTRCSGGRDGASRTATAAHAEAILADIAFNHGDGAAASAHAERSLKLARDLPASRSKAFVGFVGAFLDLSRGEAVTALARAREFQQIAEEIDDREQLAAGLQIIGGARLLASGSREIRPRLRAHRRSARRGDAARQPADDRVGRWLADACAPLERELGRRSSSRRRGDRCGGATA